MTDHFATLGEKRRPWLEEEALKEHFLALTSQHHPDVARSTSHPQEADFTAINLAYQTLRDPRARLKHLLELEAAEHRADAQPRHQPAPESINALFSRMGTIKQESDAFLKKRAAATSPLPKALLLPEQLELQEKLEGWLAELEGERAANRALLPALDALWLEGPAHPQRADVVAAMEQLVQLFGYLDKWIAQVREALMKLQIDF